MKFPDQNIFGKMPIKPEVLLSRLDQQKWQKKRNGYCPDTKELFRFLSSLRLASQFDCYPDYRRKKGAFLLD